MSPRPSVTVYPLSPRARATRNVVLDLCVAREADIELYGELVTEHVARLLTLDRLERARAVAELLDAAAVLALAGHHVELAAGVDPVEVVEDIARDAERLLRRRR